MKLTALAAVAVLALAGCSSGPTPQEKAASVALVREAMQVQVKYEAEGTALSYDVEGQAPIVKEPYADVTMKTPSGTSQSSPDLPMKGKTATVPGLTLTFTAGDSVYLSVQNNGSTDDVTCRISTESGVVISENTSTSSYGIATCQGRAR